MEKNEDEIEVNIKLNYTIFYCLFSWMYKFMLCYAVSVNYISHYKAIDLWKDFIWKSIVCKAEKIK